MVSSVWRLAIVAALAATSMLAGCERIREAIEPEREGEEEEEREEREHEGGAETEEERENRENLWRVRVTIVGEGVVRTNIEGVEAMSLECTRDEKGQSGECGPKLLHWKEGQPPLLNAHGAKGWKFVRWESRTRKWSGSIVPAARPIQPGNRLYLNGMGIHDSGDLELLTAYFEKQADPTFADVDPPTTP